MTRPSLKSRFGEQIRAFVGYKNSLGFPYNESIRILGRFDDFCVERFPEKDCLDCELALAWLEKRDTENTAGHRNRIMVIREFAKYLRAVGTEAYMIPISAAAGSVSTSLQTSRRLGRMPISGAPATGCARNTVYPW